MKTLVIGDIRGKRNWEAGSNNYYRRSIVFVGDYINLNIGYSTSKAGKPGTSHRF